MLSAASRSLVNPLTNSFDSTSGLPVLPVSTWVAPFFQLWLATRQLGEWTGQCLSATRKQPGNDGGVTVPPSAAMSASGWSTAHESRSQQNPQALVNPGESLSANSRSSADWKQLQNFRAIMRCGSICSSLYHFGISRGAIGTPEELLRWHQPLHAQRQLAVGCQSSDGARGPPISRRR
jgi:hypothetical protein